MTGNPIEQAAAEAAQSFTEDMSLEDRADALEGAMSAELDRIAVPPLGLADPRFPRDEGAVGLGGKRPEPGKRMQMGDDPRLPKMPERPTLMDFFRLRWVPGRHLLQSANLAQRNGLDEKLVLACLLHDVSVHGLVRTDHGYWGAQLVEPYVDEEVAWAIRYHQAVRFFPDPEVGYEYPEMYLKHFGQDYQIPAYIRQAYSYARNHKWYMSARLITLNDLYAFDPDVNPPLEQFEDVIGRHFSQPEEGLGFDGSLVAHMWRTMIWPNNFL